MPTCLLGRAFAETMIDSHCHLAGEEFGQDLDEVVARARDRGVTAALCILAAGNEAESMRAAAVRRAWPGVQFATGIHPHQAGDFGADPDAAITTVRAAVAEHQACAIGEIGLDYHYDFSPRDVQQTLFRAQVALAVELDVPIVIHTREATDDTFRILHEAGGRARGVFHCFTGDEAMARAAFDLGFYVSFAGIVTFPRSEGIRAAARIAPADRFLAETDAPYLAPVPHRGRRNEPAYVVEVAARLAEIRGVSAAELASQVTRNFINLFGEGGSRSNPTA
jgi:TatD DNase family protein